MEATRTAPQPPEDRFARHEPATNRTFYREGGISVTDQWLTISGRRFSIAELRNLRTVREPAAPLGLAFTVVACLAAVGAVGFAVFASDPVLMVGGPFLAVLPIGFALFTWRLRHQYFALYAEYGGQTVQVLGASDERRYNQICRALLRAREYRQDHLY